MEKKHQYQGLTKQEVEESRRLHGEISSLLQRKPLYGANFLKSSTTRLSKSYWWHGSYP